MKSGFNLQAVNRRSDHLTSMRSQQEREADQQQGFNDSTEALFSAFPGLSEAFGYFSSLANQRDMLDPQEVAKARGEVRSRILCAAEAFSELYAQSEGGSPLGERLTGGASSELDSAYSYYQQVFSAKGFLENPEQQADFEEQWGYIYAARDFIEQACSELRLLDEQPGH